MNDSLRMIALQCDSDSHRWFPNTAGDVFYMAACMAGEAGETVNEAKKVVRGSVSMDVAREKILEEAADTFVYCMNIFGMLGADPQWWYQMVREKNRARFQNNGAAIKVKDNPQA
jgi:NTP pyrophosphatase (non-canonical NTP hydrolase)